ncbi:MAG: Uma2 family endonuclease [Chloroflexi bacterium]|nr:Uma2 family endonuclease [Chloroflexota bacterium]
MTASKTLVTAEELLQLSAQGRRYELVKGELRDMAPTGNVHGRVAIRLGSRLDMYVEAHDLGEAFAAETGFRIHRNPDTVLAPDVSFIAKGRVPAEGVAPGFGDIVPDLVSEVVSPSETAASVQAKVENWLEAGVKLVWVVYPDTRSVAVYRSLEDVRVLREGDALSGDPVLPGFSCPVRELF